MAIQKTRPPALWLIMTVFSAVPFVLGIHRVVNWAWAGVIGVGCGSLVVCSVWIYSSLRTNERRYLKFREFCQSGNDPQAILLAFRQAEMEIRLNHLIFLPGIIMGGTIGFVFLHYLLSHGTPTEEGDIGIRAAFVFGGAVSFFVPLMLMERLERRFSGTTSAIRKTFHTSSREPCKQAARALTEETAARNLVRERFDSSFGPLTFTVHYDRMGFDGGNSLRKGYTPLWPEMCCACGKSLTRSDCQIVTVSHENKSHGGRTKFSVKLPLCATFSCEFDPQSGRHRASPSITDEWKPYLRLNEGQFRLNGLHRDFIAATLELNGDHLRALQQ